MTEALGGQDEIAGVYACGEHVLQEQCIVSVKGDQRIAVLLNCQRARG